MNELTTISDGGDEEEAIRILGNSLYPGAKPESIRLVLAYCKFNGLDPFLKPVHVVPTSIKLPNGNYETRDVLMPGIADYRIKAARSGEYGGKSEPEFGPDVTKTLGGITLTYPEWCRVTVRRIVQGQARDFPAKERWVENYATAKRDTDAPNKMWKQRPYGQLAKCAESQALRMAFPEFSAGYTAEEMQGKTMDGFTGETIDADPTPVQRAAAVATPRAPVVRENGKRHSIAPPKGAPDSDWRACIDYIGPAMAKLRTRAAVEETAAGPTCSDIVANGPPWARAELDALLAENYARFVIDPTQIENDPETGELPPVHIQGEHKLAAG